MMHNGNNLVPFFVDASLWTFSLLVFFFGSSTTEEVK